jgi:dipeptidyl aminopeptidase/acylaminoacyl peptidase
VFGGTLKSSGSSYTFDGQLTNYVTGLCNVTCTESPLDTDDEEDYALSPDGRTVAFLSKDIHLPPANHTSSQIYVVPFGTSAGVADAVPVNPRRGAFAARYPDAQGASAAPAFSADSTRLVWTQMDGINYESDRSILYVANATAADGEFGARRLAGNWDRSAGAALWAPDGASLLVGVSDLGRNRLFRIPVDAGDDYVPCNATDEGVLAGFAFLGNRSDAVLVSDSKIWSSRDIYTTTLSGGDTHVYYRANEVDPELAGLGPEDVTEFYYQSNSTEIKQQAWVVLPEGFDSSKKYPLAFITHGGPQGSTSNSWSTRWNLKVWADQGYVGELLSQAGFP